MTGQVPPKAPPRGVEPPHPWPRVIAGRPVGMSALEREKPRDAADFMDVAVAVVCILIAAGFAIGSLINAWPW